MLNIKNLEEKKNWFIQFLSLRGLSVMIVTYLLIFREHEKLNTQSRHTDMDETIAERRAFFEVIFENGDLSVMTADDWSHLEECLEICRFWLGQDSYQTFFDMAVMHKNKINN